MKTKIDLKKTIPILAITILLISTIAFIGIPMAQGCGWAEWENDPVDITINGIIAEDDWGAATVITPFYDVSTSEAVAAKIYIMNDDDSLYIAVEGVSPIADLSSINIDIDNDHKIGPKDLVVFLHETGDLIYTGCTEESANWDTGQYYTIEGYDHYVSTKFVELKLPLVGIEEGTTEPTLWDLSPGDTVGFMVYLSADNAAYPKEIIGKGDGAPQLPYYAHLTLAPGPMLDAEYYHIGSTVTVTVANVSANEDPYRFDTVSATVESDYPDDILLTLNETGENTGVFTGTFNLVSKNPGLNDLLVGEGNTTTVTYASLTDTAKVDDTNPSVTIKYPPDNGNVSLTYGFDVKAEVTDATSGIDIAWLTLDSPVPVAVVKDVAPGDTEPLSYTVEEVSPLTEGIHTAQVTARDGAGNENVTTWSFNIDVTGPTCVIDMNVTSPVKAVDVEFTFEFNEDMNNETTVTIEGNATGYMDFKTKDWKGYPEDKRTFSANYTVKDTPAFNGTVLLTASGAKDVAGEEMIPANFTFYIDNMNPTVPENLTATAEVGANVLDWDAATDLAPYNISYNIYYNTTEDFDVPIDTVEETTYRHATGVPETKYFYKVSAVDAAGNEGSFSDVVNATYMGAYSIELEKGWNLISLPLVPDNSSIDVVLVDVVDNVTVVWSYDAETGDWFSFKPGAPSTLTEIVDGKGYWVNMTASATLTIYGSVLPPPPEVPPAYDVVPGWNLIGYKETTRMNASTYLDGIEYKRLYAYYGGAYHLVEPSDDMVPGLGYWIAVTEEGIIYP